MAPISQSGATAVSSGSVSSRTSRAAEDVARLAQVEVIRRLEDDEGSVSFVRRNGDDLGECPGIDSFSRGGRAGREGPVVLVDLVLDALSGEPVEKGLVRSVERDLGVHRLGPHGTFSGIQRLKWIHPRTHRPLGAAGHAERPDPRSRGSGEAFRSE